MSESVNFDPKNQPNRVQRQNQTYGPNRPIGVPQPGVPSFSETLQQAQEIRFSNHAQQRIEKRQINLGENGMNRLAQAVEKAEQKGGKSSLVLMDDMAFIVNVQERMVVTAMDSKARGKGVFTQIDTVVFADESEKSNSGTSTIEKSA
ncbi:MAG: hypothetical protein CL609_04280 [Anaerolineaceae bacterium]|nr:hypothetical protein [Anaerolineaceae bacterium]